MFIFFPFLKNFLAVAELHGTEAERLQIEEKKEKHGSKYKACILSVGTEGFIIIFCILHIIKMLQHFPQVSMLLKS